MEILIINPNTAAGMTAKIGAVAMAAAAPGTSITAVNPQTGPASIEGRVDGALAVPGLLQEIACGQARGVAGHVIACIDDTGLEAAHSLSQAPVIEANLQRYGLAARCARVRAAEIPVLDLEREGSAAEKRISAEIVEALEVGRAEAIVLGCAGMADLAGRLAARHDVPVIDGVAAAVTLVEGLVRLGLRTAKRGGYAPPPAKS